jgi:MFS family permease
MVTVSLAGSLFFSLSPEEAKSKVLAYLLLTFAPFAVVSPLLGPLIDKSLSGRRLLVATSSLVRVVLCLYMGTRLKSLWLFPLAFAFLIAQKLYVVTRGTLVPDMARSLQFNDTNNEVDGWPSSHPRESDGFAGFNAQLTLLGAIAGLIAGAIAAGILRGFGGHTLLICAAAGYFLSAIAGFRLPRPIVKASRATTNFSFGDRDRQILAPLGDRSVVWGLGAAALNRFASGFTTFLLAFGLRRLHAGLGWFAAGLSISGLGAMIGLGVVTRIRAGAKETTLISLALFGLALGAIAASINGGLLQEILMVGWLGLCGAVIQPSFDAITQRHVAPKSHGRTFAKLAVRQQLMWVVGALIPVTFPLTFHAGDLLLASVAAVGTLIYVFGHGKGY